MEGICEPSRPSLTRYSQDGESVNLASRRSFRGIESTDRLNRKSTERYHNTTDAGSPLLKSRSPRGTRSKGSTIKMMPNVDI